MLILNGVAEGKELENRIPLECNLDLLNAIDFNKGCYVGQELTARTKYQVWIYCLYKFVCGVLYFILFCLYVIYDVL